LCEKLCNFPALEKIEFRTDQKSSPRPAISGGSRRKLAALKFATKSMDSETYHYFVSGARALKTTAGYN